MAWDFCRIHTHRDPLSGAINESVEHQAEVIAAIANPFSQRRTIIGERLGKPVKLLP
jgi:hypothetical protein